MLNGHDKEAKRHNRTARLRKILCGLDDDQYQEIREAYYKAAEGLTALHALLAEAGDTHAGLAGEIKHARDAEAAFDRSGLGAIL